jgi:2-oxo-3-hexenedioate decarboxylase
MVNSEQIEGFATRVDQAAKNAQTIPMLSLGGDELGLEEAYLIQRASIQRRLDRGEELIGMKMGLTSKAKMEQVGVHSPIYGHLTSAMLLEHGGRLNLANHCHPRVEPEVAFILARDLHGPVSAEEALDAVEAICPALEVIDSRYRDFKFTLGDVIADNASSSRFILGPARVKPDAVELGNLGMVMEINGSPAQIGCSAAIYEHPANSLAELANLLAPLGRHLKAGWVVMSGGATAAEHLKAGDQVRLLVHELGTAEFSVDA